jgi:hypothetical protein
MPAHINPRFWEVHRVPFISTLDESEDLQAKPVPQSPASVNRSDLASEEISDATSGLTAKKNARPSRHYHITQRHSIIVASVTLNAHGSSLVGGSTKLNSPH